MQPVVTKTQLLCFFGYLGQDGLIKVADEGSNRYTATAKISSQWTNWMKFNYSLRFVRKDYHRPQSLGSGVYEYLGGQWPCVPLYDRMVISIMRW